jgi:hypothetical protein
VLQARSAKHREGFQPYGPPISPVIRTRIVLKSRFQGMNDRESAFVSTPPILTQREHAPESDFGRFIRAALD